MCARPRARQPTTKRSRYCASTPSTRRHRWNRSPTAARPPRPSLVPLRQLDQAMDHLPISCRRRKAESLSKERVQTSGPATTSGAVKTDFAPTQAKRVPSIAALCRCGAHDFFRCRGKESNVQCRWINIAQVQKWISWNDYFHLRGGAVEYRHPESILVCDFIFDLGGDHRRLCSGAPKTTFPLWSQVGTCSNPSDSNRSALNSVIRIVLRPPTLMPRNITIYFRIVKSDRFVCTGFAMQPKLRTRARR